MQSGRCCIRLRRSTTDIIQIFTAHKAIIVSLTANSELGDTIVRALLVSPLFKLQLTGKQAYSPIDYPTPRLMEINYRYN
jgi:hypothetical protein